MLQKLGTDYLDLLYIHAPWPSVEWQAAVSQIDELIDEGVVRQLGVSNFNVAQMREVQSLAKHRIAANQMFYNCLFRKEVDEEFRAFCEQEAIEIVAYRPVNRGEFMKHETLVDIAAEHNATAAQIAIAWLLQDRSLPLVKAIQPAHIDENLAALDITLTDADLARIDAASATYQLT